ncbi:MAG: hypothetical protein ACE5E7_13165, partial [Anaerolineae bacterium]
MPDSPTNRDEINVHGRPVGSAVGGGRVQARNIAGGDIHEHTHYPAAEVTFPLIHLPPANPNFTGREKELTAIENALHHDENTLAITQAITGLGGVGKTQLALAYAHAHRDDYALIWQLRADEAATLDGDLRQLGAALNLPLADKDAATARAMTLARLNGMDEKWLLIYDNADALAPRELRPYLPGGRGHRLITTRRARWQGAQTLRLGVFSVDEAMDFWQRRLAQRFVKSAGFDKSWADLAAELGRLPLALEQAAAYMVARGKTASDYLRLYRQQRAALWDRQPPPEDYEKTVTTTWEMAFEYARQTPGAAALLNLCCFLAPEEIPLEVIITHAGALPEDLAAVLADELARDDAVAALTTYSLMTQADGKLSLHRLVAAVARERMGAERATMWAEAAV